MPTQPRLPRGFLPEVLDHLLAPHGVRVRRNVAHLHKYTAGPESISRIEWEVTSSFAPGRFDALAKPRCAAAKAAAEGGVFVSVLVSRSSRYRRLTAEAVRDQFRADTAALSRINARRRNTQALREGIGLALAAFHVGVLPSGCLRPHWHLLFSVEGASGAAAIGDIKRVLALHGFTVRGVDDHTGPSVVESDRLSHVIEYAFNYPVTLYRSPYRAGKMDLGHAIYAGEVEASALLPALLGLVGERGRMVQTIRCYGVLSRRGNGEKRASGSKRKRRDCVTPASGNSDSALLKKLGEEMVRELGGVVAEKTPEEEAAEHVAELEKQEPWMQRVREVHAIAEGRCSLWPIPNKWYDFLGPTGGFGKVIVEVDPAEPLPMTVEEMAAAIAAERLEVAHPKPVTRRRILHREKRPHHQFPTIEVTVAVVEWWPEDTGVCLPGSLDQFRDERGPSVSDIEAEFPELADAWRRERAALAAARLAEQEKAAAEVAVWLPAAA